MNGNCWGHRLVKGAKISMDVVEVASPTAPPGNGGGKWDGVVWAQCDALPLGPASNCKIVDDGGGGWRSTGRRRRSKTYFCTGWARILVVVGGSDPGLGDPKIL